MAKRFGITRRMLVDDLEGAVHRAYGSLPNMSYIVHRGIVVYRADWTDVRTISMALDQLVFQWGAIRSKRRMNPYYLEWAPMRETDMGPFLTLLLEIAGTRAVDEYIAACDHTYGAHFAEDLKRWCRRNVV